MNRIQPRTTNLKDVLPLRFPMIINVDPTSVCNMTCKFCYHSVGLNPKGVMKFDLFTKIINDIKESGTKLKVLRLYAFGEPLLNKNFVEMVKYAKEAGIAETIDTTSNGSFLTPELNLRLIDAGLDRINISVYGMNDSQYLDFTGAKIDFNKYVENIKHLYENRKKCFIFIKINGDEIPKEDVQEFLKIFTPISDGIAVEHTMHCWNDFDPAGNGVNKNVGIYGQPLHEVMVCPYIFYSMTIQYDGSVSACFLDWNRKLTMGNVSEMSISSIWEGEEFKKMRLAMLKMERHKLDPCSKCQQMVAGAPENIDMYANRLLKVYGS